MHPVPPPSLPLEKCVQCTFTTASKSALEDHIKASHNETCLQESPIPWHLCLMTFNSQPGLNVHMISAHPLVANPLPDSELPSTAGTFHCKKCNFTVSTKFAFQLHTQSDHMPIEHPFPCSTCGKLFSEINDLNDHVKRSHSNIRDPASIISLCARILDHYKFWSQ